MHAAMFLSTCLQVLCGNDMLAIGMPSVRCKWRSSCDAVLHSAPIPLLSRRGVAIDGREEGRCPAMIGNEIAFDD